MNPNESPGIPMRPRSSARRWRWFGAWLLLAIYFVAPPRGVFDQSLDDSNYATYSYFLTHHFQWGANVLPMPGPLGFLIYGHTYSGELYGTRVLGDFLLKAFFVAMVLRLFHRAGKGALRWVWLAAVILMAPLVDDLVHDLSILLATLVLLAELGPRVTRWAASAAFLLGVVTLIKGNHPVTTAMCLGAVWILCAFEREWRSGLKLTAIYVLSILGCWVLAGQNPLHIPGYLVATLQLSMGYNAAMGLEAASIFTVTGLVLVACLLLVFAWAAAVGSRHRRAIVALLLLAGFTLIKWKHGYVRADGHVYIFFTAVAIFTLTVCLVSLTGLLSAPPPPLSRDARRIGFALVALTTVLSLLGAAEFSLSKIGHFAGDAPGVLQRNARYLVRPGFFRQPLDRRLELNRRIAQVPQIQAEVGRETVDFFGVEEGLLLLNNLDYQPRPMGGGTFNVFNAWVQDRNEAFVRDPRRAPPWQVVKLQNLDRRFPAADDGTTLRAVLEFYSPVLIQRDYLLLHRRAPEPAIPAPRLLESRPLKLGQALTPPPVRPGEILLFTINAPLSWAGSLRAFFYRPPELTAHVASLRRPFGETFVMKPSMLQRPVILSPLLADNSDLIELYGGSPGNVVRSITFASQPGFAVDDLSISFFSVPRPTKAESADPAELLTYRRHPLYNRTPLELVTEETGIRELYDEPVTIVHAPGSITWDLRPDDRQVVFSFGLMPQTYLDGGTTDGVGFNVEVIWPPKDGRVLIRKLLTPLTVPADRGMHRLRVYLPPFEPGARLRIRTDTGPGTNGAYDQSYVTHLQIKSGPPDPGQFNGLGVVPADGRLPHGAIASVDGRDVFLIHAPATLALSLPADAREFGCEIGLLRSAYENGGHTDGVDYTFEAVTPDGERRMLLRRTLSPYQHPEDRGAQAVTIPLPALPPGTQLVVSTGTGPANDPGWDQSYIRAAGFK
ncbi:MAG: hypothetical protein JWM88_2935 [Verrucomicrobia bacterium]|nr:hypothetical protein [Verrucomicrobiota bacterium]